MSSSALPLAALEARLHRRRRWLLQLLPRWARRERGRARSATGRRPSRSIPSRNPTCDARAAPSRGDDPQAAAFRTTDLEAAHALNCERCFSRASSCADAFCSGDLAKTPLGGP